jgi:hypothetical protein
LESCGKCLSENISVPYRLEDTQLLQIVGRQNLVTKFNRKVRSVSEEIIKNVKLHVETAPYFETHVRPHSHTTCFIMKDIIKHIGITLGYGLDDRGSRVRFPAEAGSFSLHHRVQNGPGAHPASYPMGTRGDRGVKLTTHLHLVPRSKNAWSYTSTPRIHLHGMVLI